MTGTFIKSATWWKIPSCISSNGVALQRGTRRNLRPFWQSFKSDALLYGLVFRDDTL